MRLIRFVVLLVAAVALVAGCSSGAGTSSGPAGQDALAFRSTTLDGAPFAGSSLAGKPVVLWFWAPWCPVCRSEAPSVARVAQQHPDVTFVGVAALDQVPAMKQFVAANHLGFANLADTDTSVWRHFGVTQQPAFAFVSPRGTTDVVKGGLSEQDLAGRLAGLPQA